MLKLTAILAALTLSSLSYADSISLTDKEVAHDASACPDLTGDYTFKMLETTVETSCKSSKNEAGLDVVTFNAKPEESAVLDGKRKDAPNGLTETVLCNSQTIYFYDYEKDSLVSVSTMKLDAEKNLVIYFNDNGNEQTILMERKK